MDKLRMIDGVESGGTGKQKQKEPTQIVSHP
jgi:hypothetical protein